MDKATAKCVIDRLKLERNLLGAIGHDVSRISIGHPLPEYNATGLGVHDIDYVLACDDHGGIIVRPRPGYWQWEMRGDVCIALQDLVLLGLRNFLGRETVGGA